MPLLRSIPNKREMLARGLERLGMWAALERLAKRPGLVALAYHRIGHPDRDPFYRPVFSATPEAFRSQLLRIKASFRILSLDELIEIATTGFRLREPCAVITFDDGYRDNYDIARPILAELGIPATFFLPTAFLTQPRLFWWDHVAYVVRRTERERMALDLPRPISIDLHSTARDVALAEVIRAYLDSEPIDERRLLIHLEERAAVPVDSEALARGLIMRWDHVRELRQGGMSFGSHTRTHRSLAHLDESEQVRELAGSREELENALGEKIVSLAYPYGIPSAFSPMTKRLATQSGYRLAFAFRSGVNRPDRIDPLAVSRINVGLADSASIVRARIVSLSVLGRSVF